MSLKEWTRKPISSCDGQRQARVEVALRDRARALDQVLDRLHQPLRGEDRAVPGGEQREQQHHGERQDEARLERPAQIVLLAVLLVGGLHGVGERAQAFGDRVDGLHAASARGPAPWRRPARPCAPGSRRSTCGSRLTKGRPWRTCSSSSSGSCSGTRSAESPLLDAISVPRLGRDRELERAARAGAATRADRGRRRCRRPAHRRSARCDASCSRIRTSSAERDSTSASSRLRRISTLNQLSMPLLRNCTAKKYTSRIGSVASTPKIHDHACLEPRADHVAAPVAHQLDELGAEQHQQHDQPRDVDHQDPRMQAAELLGVLRGLRHEQDRGQPQQAADARSGRPNRRALGLQRPRVPLAGCAPVVGPEEQPLERRGRTSMSSTARTRTL